MLAPIIKNLITPISVISAMAFPLMANSAGFGFDKTRLIIADGKDSGSITIQNGNENGLLIKSHVEDADMVLSRDARAVPKMFQVKGNHSGRIRVVVNPASLPKDRETQFWLYTKAFPEIKLDNKNSNQMQVNFVTRLKVFYRPQGLKADIKKANATLKWSNQDGRLTAKNDSPLNLTVIGVDVGAKHVSTSHVIKPYSQWNTGVKLSEGQTKVRWEAMNDLGGSDKNEAKIH